MKLSILSGKLSTLCIALSFAWSRLSNFKRENPIATQGPMEEKEGGEYDGGKEVVGLREISVTREGKGSAAGQDSSSR